MLSSSFILSNIRSKIFLRITENMLSDYWILIIYLIYNCDYNYIKIIPLNHDDLLVAKTEKYKNEIYITYIRYNVINSMPQMDSITTSLVD